MSKLNPKAVLEWSREGLRGARIGDRAPTTYESLEEAGRALQGTPIVLALSRRTVFYRSAYLPDAGRDEVALVLQTQADSMFPLGAGDLAIAFEASPESGPSGRLYRVAAIRDTDLESLLAECKLAGLSIAAVLPAGLAGERALSEHGVTTGIAVEQTPEGVALDAVVNGVLRASRIGLAGSETEAEVAAISQSVGLESPTIVREAPGAWGPMRLIELADEHRHLNLQPRSAQSKQAGAKARGRSRLAALLLVAAFAAVALTYFDYSDGQRAVKREQGRAQASLRQLKTARDAAESDVLKTVATESTLKRLFEPAQSLGDIATHTANLVPDGVWLTGLSVERGKEMTMRGTARNSEALALFLDRLRGSERLRGVRLVASNNADIETTAVVQFSIAAFPVGNVPAIEESGRRRS